MPNGRDIDEWFELIDRVCMEWEERTALTLEFQEYVKVYQKDVNNYLLIDAAGKYKSIGSYVKKLSPLDYDLPIVNKALVNYMVSGVPIEKTINDCNDLIEFQLVAKITNKYTHILHGDQPIKEKCVRLFASKDKQDQGVQKAHAKTGRLAKIPNSPLYCFIFNERVNGVKVPAKLDKQWYINLANKRLAGFGL
jgi:DNA polymerase